MTRSGPASEARSHHPGRRRERAQLGLSFHSWGGRRPGAGRPRTEGSGLPHRRRSPVASRHPVHLSLRVEPKLPSLRRAKERAVLEKCFREGKERAGFRLVHYSIQHHHIHLIVEAQGAEALSSGVRGLSIRIARLLNTLLGRKGRVFAERYFARALKTPREVHHCLRYVLLNGTKHEAQRGVAYPRGGKDPCSSARYFDGFRGVVPVPLDEDTSPVAQARTYLLRKGWRVHGLISLCDIPGLPP